MRTHRVILGALLAMACAGRSEDHGDRPEGPGERCEAGVLVIDGPVRAIRALYPTPEAPLRLRSHLANPAAFITVEAGGWLKFDLYEAVPAGAIATIETHDVSTGEPLCPLEFVVE